MLLLLVSNSIVYMQWNPYNLIQEIYSNINLSIFKKCCHNIQTESMDMSYSTKSEYSFLISNRAMVNLAYACYTFCDGNQKYQEKGFFADF